MKTVSVADRCCPYLVAAALLLPAGQASAVGVIFRYLPGSAALSSAVEVRHVETGPFLDPREHRARNPGGWGYNAPWAADFEGAKSVMWGGGSSSLSQPSGPDVTVEAWARLFEREDAHTLVTNRVGMRDGLTLGVERGLPYFEVVMSGKSYRIEGSKEVFADQDVWLAATAEYTFSNTLILRIFRDGRLEAEETIPATLATPYVISRPFFVGTRAAGTEDAPTLTGTITGLVYAAMVRDYVARPAYLNTSPPFDGSVYFGMPAFHDYEVGSFQLPMDQRIDTYTTPISHRFFLPHVNDSFIPQGTAVVSGDAGQATLVYVAYYHRTRDNRRATRHSIVAEIDAATGRLRRTFRLMGLLRTAHVGGLAVVGDALYVASEGLLERYLLPAYEEVADRYVDLAADPDGTRSVSGKASFVSAFADTLWVGDYRTAGQSQPYLYGYPLDGAGLPMRGASPAIYPIPRKIQGVDLYALEGSTYVFMARNRNSREGEVLRFTRAALNSHSLPVWQESLSFPHGMEDLAFSQDGTLWTNSESGTDYYQRAAQWSSFYPFVYGVAQPDLFPSVNSADRRRAPLPPLRLEVFPNPAIDRVNINYYLNHPSIVRLQVVDLLGREARVAAYPRQGPGGHTVTWAVGDLVAGVYLLVLEAAGSKVHRPIVLLH